MCWLRSSRRSPPGTRFASLMNASSFQLGEAGLGPLTRYRWRYAKWHACIWLSGQTPAVVRRRNGGSKAGVTLELSPTQSWLAP